MSLSLDLGTKPKGLEVKTWGTDKEVVYLGEYQITTEDFLAAAHYVLTNSNLTQKDPRLQFVKCVRSMKVSRGYLSVVDGKKLRTRRLSSNIPPIIIK